MDSGNIRDYLDMAPTSRSIAAAMLMPAVIYVFDWQTIDLNSTLPCPAVRNQLLLIVADIVGFYRLTVESAI